MQWLQCWHVHHRRGSTSRMYSCHEVGKQCFLYRQTACQISKSYILILSFPFSFYVTEIPNIRRSYSISRQHPQRYPKSTISKWYHETIYTLSRYIFTARSYGSKRNNPQNILILTILLYELPSKNIHWLWCKGINQSCRIIYTFQYRL